MSQYNEEVQPQDTNEASSYMDYSTFPDPHENFTGIDFKVQYAIPHMQ